MLKQTLLLAILMFLTFGMTLPARAEDAIRITSMGIFVWPEYDQPGVLVQYQGEIAATADKSNPREISFFVPKGAGVGAACAIKADGNHTSETWKESDMEENLVKISFMVTEPRFHVEYYYNPLVGSPDKKMTFVYTAALPADELHVDIQHPLKATNFVLTPEAPESHKDDEGFVYHTYTFKQVAAGQKLSTSIAYTKTDPNPSVSGQKKPAASTSAPSDSGINLNQAIVIGIALGVVGIVGFFVWERNTRRARSVHVEAFEVNHRVGVPSRGGYCTQCGNAMHVGDRFCARCGSPVADI
jgi:hypothetical protein